MTINCTYWSDCGITRGGCCSHPKMPYAPRVSRRVCGGCSYREPVDPARPAGNEPSHAAGVGDRMHELLEARYGLKPCQKCREMIERMNALGPDGCRQHGDELIDEIWQRRDKLQGWRHLAAKLPGAETIAKRELGELLDQVTTKVHDSSSA